MPSTLELKATFTPTEATFRIDSGNRHVIWSHLKASDTVTIDSNAPLTIDEEDLKHVRRQFHFWFRDVVRFYSPVTAAVEGTTLFQKESEGNKKRLVFHRDNTVAAFEYDIVAKTMKIDFSPGHSVIGFMNLVRAFYEFSQWIDSGFVLFPTEYKIAEDFVLRHKLDSI